MNSARQAPHFSEGMAFPELPRSSFHGLPGLLATREGGPTLFTVLLASLCVATHAWWRCHRRVTTSPRRIGRRI